MKELDRRRREREEEEQRRAEELRLKHEAERKKVEAQLAKEHAVFDAQAAKERAESEAAKVRGYCVVVLKHPQNQTWRCPGSFSFRTAHVNFAFAPFFAP